MFAISPIMQRFALPGIVGVLCVLIGIWQQIGWLKIAGIILAVPVTWAYVVLICVYIPGLLLDFIRSCFRGNDRA